MIALCKYCNKVISDEDMAKTDAEVKRTGGGAKNVGHLGGYLFAHTKCYEEQQEEK